MSKGMRRVSRDMHDRCLQACWHRRAEITDREHLALNIVAGAGACNDPVTRAELEAAQTILARLDRNTTTP
jgi:hypothetical protein